MNPENTENLPKYACRECGSDELRGEMHGFEVFRAEGDKIIHVRSEGTDGGLGGLFCYECDEPIPVEGSFSTVPIE